MKKLTTEKEQQIRASFGRQNLMKLYNASVENVAEGFFEISVPHQEALTRVSGIFNGGVLSALADTSAGYAAVTLKETGAYFLTVEMKISYLNPARGEKLIAKAEVIKSGKTLTVSKADIFTVTGKEESLVATSLVTLM
jgi:uncharacterized protein (TIGR00369 family)